MMKVLIDNGHGVEGKQCVTDITVEGIKKYLTKK